MIKLVWLLFLVASIQGYYISHNVKEAVESVVLDNFQILISDSEQDKDFPDEFLINLVHIDENLNVTFVRKAKLEEPGIYRVDKNGNPFRYHLKNAEVI